MRRRELLFGFGSIALAPALMRGQSARAQATPGASPTAGANGGPLGDILALAPDVLAGPAAPLVQIATYANPGLQLASLGMDPGQESESDWLNATYWLVFPGGIAEYTREPGWREAFGFEARQIDEALEVGEPPNQIKLLRGRFDPDELRATWTASGYARVDVPGAEAYSWAEDGAIDFASDVSRFGVGSMNNAAILADGTLLFARSLADLRAAAGAAAGSSLALGENPRVAGLAASLDPAWVSGFLVLPEAVRGTIPGEGEGEMPRPELVAVGVTAGGPLPRPFSDPEATPPALPPGTPLARDGVSLLFPDRAAAEAAMPVVDRRLREGISLVSNLPYREFFPAWTFEVAPGAPVLHVGLDNDPEGRPGRVLQMLIQRDLHFVAWDG